MMRRLIVGFRAESAEKTLKLKVTTFYSTFTLQLLWSQKISENTTESKT